ncbi:MAG: hypothetical protein ACI89L_001035 [Phycisphaerales bacterium]|jgi:hypothetical protein
MTDDHSTREIYVGYLGLPRAHLSFLRIAIPMTLLFLLVVSALIANRAEPAGDAAWDTTEQAWTGVLQMQPYPVLFTEPDEDGHSAWLLVELNKKGAHDRLAGFDGQAVQVTGYRLRREGRSMIELSPDDPATSPDEAVVPIQTFAPMADPPAQVELGVVTLSGEIVDGKCFLGAMRPGEGVTHKACATLCIRGGLPPMLATRNPDGSIRMLLLSIDGEVALPEPMLPRVAEPVQVTGLLTRYGSLEILQTVPDAVLSR